MEASEPKWVNPNDIWYAVNSLRLGGLHFILYTKILSPVIVNERHLILYNKHYSLQALWLINIFTKLLIYALCRPSNIQFKINPTKTSGLNNLMSNQIKIQRNIFLFKVVKFHEKTLKNEIYSYNHIWMSHDERNNINVRFHYKRDTCY